MNRYETVFILTPVLSEQLAKEAVQDYKKEIKNHGGKVMQDEDWGLKKLAYPIQKKTTGFYHLIDFEAEGTTIAELELTLKRDERVMRFLTVKMDKHHEEYANRSLKKETAKA